LRTVSGLSTDEIARAFVVTRETMAQRIVRAQWKISNAGIPFEIPEASHLSRRLEAVSSVLYLIFNEGYAPYASSELRFDLCNEAIRLVALLDELLPEHEEIAGLRSLMLLHSSRFDSRIGGDGIAIALENQDRGLWRRDLIAEGTRLLERALRRGKPGPYQLQAAIAAIHCEAADFAATDWREIVMIYSRLLQIQPNPVFTLNRTVALSYAEGADRALPQLLALEPELSGYQPYHAAKADMLARAEKVQDAGAAFEKAIAMSRHEPERNFLRSRLRALLAPPLVTEVTLARLAPDPISNAAVDRSSANGTSSSDAGE
jgi:RNA polymerase sigma-70 factor (ECF subfamily)